MGCFTHGCQCQGAECTCKRCRSSCLTFTFNGRNPSNTSSQGGGHNLTTFTSGGGPPYASSGAGGHLPAQTTYGNAGGYVGNTGGYAGNTGGYSVNTGGYGSNTGGAGGYPSAQTNYSTAGVHPSVQTNYGNASGYGGNTSGAGGYQAQSGSTQPVEAGATHQSNNHEMGSRTPPIRPRELDSSPAPTISYLPNNVRSYQEQLSYREKLYVPNTAILSALSA
ncbi:hypothetical protein B0J11DRAFT_512931 [Dendryphion nanum]|uniref:Uncharacterized protein n=1 Tax=Dendryphion nanum TaxID=256645 RepID=A0A9P9CYP1_9PLEO|nr:hypothetical protein B0J11DRAFT_512931 [Dendryphion nanum]